MSPNQARLSSGKLVKRWQFGGYDADYFCSCSGRVVAVRTGWRLVPSVHQSASWCGCAWPPEPCGP